MAAYLPVFYFALVAGALPVVLLVLMALFRPSRPNATKLEPYECGVEATTSAFDTASRCATS